MIRPLADRAFCTRPIVRAAAQELELSERQVYALVKRYRLSGGTLDALVPAVSGGGRGKTRINQGQEALVSELIDRVYLSSQRLSAETFIREVRRHCQTMAL